MRNMILKQIVAWTLLIIATSATGTQIFAQDQSRANIDVLEESLKPGRGARALEGSWTVQTTIRNCQTGQAVATFAKMVTFMQGGTAQEDSVGSAPLSRSSAHGVWRYEGSQDFSYALQFFRFNADGTYGTLTKARWQVQMGNPADTYEASATIQVFNPVGVLIASACATETATRFE